jgi:hypothetical protein
MVLTRNQCDKTTVVIPMEQHSFISYQNKLIEGGYVKVNRAVF